MASFVSGIFPAVEPAFENRQAADHGVSALQTQVPQPTTAEQMVELQSQGQSASQIALSLGLPESEVLSTLGVTAQPAASTLSVLSIHA